MAHSWPCSMARSRALNPFRSTLVTSALYVSSVSTTFKWPSRQARWRGVIWDEEEGGGGKEGEGQGRRGKDRERGGRRGQWGERKGIKL